MPPSGLLIVDVQKGFINSFTEHVPELVEGLQHRYDMVFISRFLNPEDSMHRRLIGWKRFAPGSDDVELAFTPRADAIVFDKTTYTCLTPGLAQTLERDGMDKIHLCGIATDNCVLKTAVDLFEAGIEPVVLANACASHGGIDCHRAGLKLLRRFIGNGQVVEEI